MRTSRGLAAVGAAIVTISSVTAVLAAEPAGASTPAGRLAGMVEVGHARIDPTSPWLMSAGWPLDGSVQLVSLAPSVDRPADGLSTWLIGDRISAAVHHPARARYLGSVEWSDPRFIGWLSMAWARDLYGPTGDDATASVDRLRIDLGGDGGSWVGDLTGIGDPVAGTAHLAGTLHGTGSYSGSIAVIEVTATHDGNTWALDGMVVDRTPPVS